MRVTRKVFWKYGQQELYWYHSITVYVLCKLIDKCECLFFSQITLFQGADSVLAYLSLIYLIRVTIYDMMWVHFSKNSTIYWKENKILFLSSNTIKVDMVLSQFWIDCTDYESCKLNWNCIEMKGEKVMLIHKLNKYILKVINKVH